MSCGSSKTPKVTDPGPGLRRVLPWAAVLLVLAFLSCSPSPNKAHIETVSLTPGVSWHRSIGGDGRPHHFRFTVKADRFLHLVVEQREVDVVVLLKDPAGRLLYEVDSPSGATGPETVLAVTAAAGEHTLAIEPAVAGEGSAFDLTVHAARPAGPRDRLLAPAATLYTRAERRQNEEDFQAAIPGYREALARFDALGERDRAAKTQWHLGESLLATGELARAEAVLTQALARFRGLNDGQGEARVLVDLGQVRMLLGDSGGALEAHERSLRLYREAGNEPGQASALNNVGLVLKNTGDLQEAIRRYEEALVLWRRLGSRSAEAGTLQNLGSLYVLIGHDAEGMDLLQRALQLVEGGKDSDRMEILIALAWARYLAGSPEAALDLYREAIDLARRLGDRSAEAGAWDRRGSALRALRRYGEAADSYSRALKIVRGLGSRVDQGHTLANLGWLDLETGDAKRASRRLREAVDLLAASGEPNGETHARIGLSRAERRLGAYGRAREQIDLAVRQVEEMREGLQGARSRGTFLAARYDAHEELVALLLDLHRRNPGGGHAREALEAAERARARNLSEELAADDDPGEGTGRRGTLLGEIRELEERRERIALESPRDARLRELDAELRQRGLELDRLADAPTRQPGLRPLSAGRIQGLAGEGSLLVFYLLSEPESFAWTVDRKGIEAHVLPGRERIETLARRLVAAMSQTYQVASRKAGESAARELSAAILAPLRHRLEGRKRLVILADGALHLVPFAGLPVPAPGAAPGAAAGAGDPEPLVVRHEIDLIPSATFLAQQRRLLAGRRPAPGAVAVLADPVFSLQEGRTKSRAARGFQPPGPFRRLPYTRQEAEAILRLAASQETLVRLGPDAHRDLVTSGTLGRYRIVHFATHGVLHPVLPERSGIVLSRYDETGKPREGFLAAPDVAGLDLPAELVVLSACQTGLGREMRGEGLVGLTQAFFRAGARRVVVSHWNVQDQATAELMARFYRGLLAERLPPGAALRAAQLGLRAETKWKSPYFWAGFSLHGDWQ